MEMIRSFLPVGQGAFYTEQFSGSFGQINVVYDCGSQTSLPLLRRQIQQTFAPGSVIDAVFISHLHADHINGLPFLLTHYRVKNLFFPLLTQEHRQLLLLRDLVAPNGPTTPFLTSFLTNPYQAFGELDLDYTPTLYQIRDYRQPDLSSNLDAISLPSGETVSHIILPGGDKDLDDWLYLPFNFQQDTRLAILRSALRKIFHRDYSPEELAEGLEDGTISYADLRQAYHQVPNTFNTNSMTLLSSSQSSQYAQVPLSPNLAVNLRQCSSHCSQSQCCVSSYPSGCLYTGDYEASKPPLYQELAHAYDSYMADIGCLQLPHHGSRYNYNTDLSHLPACMFYIASAASSNKNHHPHASVLKDILAHNRLPLPVSEQTDSLVSFLVRPLPFPPSALCPP